MLPKASLTIFPLLAGLSVISPLSAQTVDLAASQSLGEMMGQNDTQDSAKQALSFQQKLLALGSNSPESETVGAGVTALIDTNNTLLIYPPAVSTLAMMDSLLSESSPQGEMTISSEATPSGEILATLSETANPADSSTVATLVHPESSAKVGGATKIGVMLDQLAVKKRSLKEGPANSVEDQVMAKILPAPEVASEVVTPVSSQEATAPSPAPMVNETPVSLTQPPLQTAQASTTTTEPTLPELQQQLLIDPILVSGGERTYPPSLTFGAPGAFGPQWGDLFFGLYGSTAGKARDGQVDGGLSAGFGIGDAEKLISIGFSYNMGSLNNFGESGGFDLSASRILYATGTTQVALGGGWQNFAQYGSDFPSGAWGALSVYTLLQPENPINTLPMLLTAGAGGGSYRQGNASTGVFGGIGLQLAPQLGSGIAWSGVGLNVGLSFVPVPTIPLTITAQGLDLTDNSEGGTRFLLSVGYGFNFLPNLAGQQ